MENKKGVERIGRGLPCMVDPGCIPSITYSLSTEDLLLFYYRDPLYLLPYSTPLECFAKAPFPPLQMFDSLVLSLCPASQALTAPSIRQLLPPSKSGHLAPLSAHASSLSIPESLPSVHCGGAQHFSLSTDAAAFLQAWLTKTIRKPQG